MPMYNNQRDEIADTLMQQRGASTFDYGLAGLGSAQQPMASMTAGPQLAGLPQTPAGGVPGAGIGPAAPSNVQLPPQRAGMMGAMPMMGGLGQAPGLARAPGLGGMPPPGQQRRRPGMPY
jgi:hypothetical protein